MPHFKTLLDPSIFVGACDLPTDKTVQIARVVREKLPERDGDKESQSSPMIYFNANGKELAKRYKVPRSVMYGLSLTFGTDVDAWIGKDVTLFAARCMSFGTAEECVRIRFDTATDNRIRAWLKKRKASPSVYMIADAQ